MDNHPQLTFVVPVRNNRSIIGATLRSIAAQSFRDCECLVIDGVSTDGTPEYVREQFPWVTVIRKDSDSGPATSRSIGIRQSRSPFIALVDSDVQLNANWAAEQLGVMQRCPGVGISGSRLLYGARPGLLYATVGAMNRYGVSWDGGQGEPAEEHRDMRRCIWCNTSAIMVRRDAIETAGAFDNRMFYVHEDSDFGWRVNLSGFEVVYNPCAIATHDVHGTIDPEGHSELFAYLVRRNRLRSLLVNYEWPSIFRYVLPYLALSVVELLPGPWRWPKLKALLWNLFYIPDTFQRRRLVQSRRKVSDAALWPLFEPGLRGPRLDALARLRAAAETHRTGVPR